MPRKSVAPVASATPARAKSGAARKKKPSKSTTQPPRTAPDKTLHTFANPSPSRDYLVHIEVPEFTCHCPLTGQPDFATIEIDYIADRRNLELKALKLYMWSYRDQGAFHEACTNRILDDLVAASKPRFMRITAHWYVRGGIFTTVMAEHHKRGFKIAPVMQLGTFASPPSTR